MRGIRQRPEYLISKISIQSSITKMEYLFLILAAEKCRNKIGTSNYLISTDIIDLSLDGESSGKLRGNNLLGTEFTIFDNGVNPIRTSTDPEHHRREMAAIIYETNIFGFKGPRKITVLIPDIDNEHQRIEVQPRNEQESLIERWKRNDMKNILELHNKTPIWNEDSKSYILKFIDNRVTEASIKNFQIIRNCDDKTEDIVMQFGRVSDDMFTCDFRYPLCAMQAFGIALSSFNSRLGRE
ncbi:unnamed protein product [Didymodactylos carnosus]|uniref:Tubby C-terminal domain-containing protein n=1 Tax=Didymodactylos carnosus TaxID=1234261 RepID=A0A8S2GFU4_9BILA|nr:unnamed protein product [Didymodactylos carnosus]CAF3511693.1 unnamed protein product [Didymodactylos carnosus]